MFTFDTTGQDRQHLSGVSHKSSGRHEVSPLPSAGTGTSDLGRDTPPVPTCETHSRSPQHRSGLAVPRGTKTGKLTAGQRNRAANLEHVRCGSSGLVCLKGNHTLSPVVCRTGGVSWQRCSVPRVARPLALCLPTDTTYLGSAQSGSGNGPQSAFDRSQVAEHAMVSLVADSNSRATQSTTLKEGLTVADGGLPVAPLPGQAETLGLATGGNQSVMGCSEGVKHTVLNARAQSTRAMYANRWKLFTAWCSTHSLDPSGCPVTAVLEFLQHLLDEGRSPATLKVYVAAFSAHRAPVEGVSLGAHKLVVAFLKGAQRLHPRPRVVSAPWDLHIVLDSLCLPPFEPLEHADIKWLSLKTVFLLAITSAKRVGELHALSVSAPCMQWRPNEVTMWPNPCFLPKVQSPQFPYHFGCFSF